MSPTRSAGRPLEQQWCGWPPSAAVVGDKAKEFRRARAEGGCGGEDEGVYFVNNISRLKPAPGGKSIWLYTDKFKQCV